MPEKEMGIPEAWDCVLGPSPRAAGGNRTPYTFSSWLVIRSSSSASESRQMEHIFSSFHIYNNSLVENWNHSVLRVPPQVDPGTYLNILHHCQLTPGSIAGMELDAVNVLSPKKPCTSFHWTACVNQHILVTLSIPWNCTQNSLFLSLFFFFCLVSCFVLFWLALFCLCHLVRWKIQGAKRFSFV